MLAKPSLESLKRCLANAEQAGFRTETIAVLDKPDSVTRDLIRGQGPEGARIIEVDFGDLGLSRNHAIGLAEGTYLAFLDADDLWGINWLTEAASMAATRSEPVIWHPEICVFFGASRHILCHIDMEDEAFSHAAMALENYWTALSFGAREIYAANPYPRTDLKDGFGFEDWTWNMETISRDILHKVVPNTGHVIRRKEQSLSRETIGMQAVPRPTSYLTHYLRSRG